MRLGLDATPLLGPRAGIARYTAGVLRELATGTDEVIATAFTVRGSADLAGAVPAGVRVRTRRTPARGLQALWARGEWPPAELICGPVDVFHATNYVLPPLRRARGVVALHDLNYLRRPGTVTRATGRLRELVPRSLARASAVTVLTHELARQVEAEYSPRLPVVVTGVGVDEEWFAATPPGPELRARLGLPAQYLLFVGTLEPRKDLPTLLAAHALLPGAPPLVLVGAVGWGEALPPGGWLPTGFLDDDVTRQVVAGASALVLPSLDEGFGIPVVEAMAAGTPVVASDLPVLREVGGEAARYATVGDPEAFAAALGAVLADPGDPAPRVANARRYTWPAVAAAVRSAYALALA